eukprot:TRINITY_DN29785_c0_g1_i1.p1 TRINITY_DN29785_c0_g1~~TRINITY_DN29785_c0_g1_i1.p1  ORF type:complete len:327 (-),score=52.14 TRINITY_DN29785_c0_g1_i1:85-1023(-)
MAEPPPPPPPCPPEPPDVSETESEDEDVGDLLPPPPPAAFKTRASVSAEAFGEWNKRVAFQPPVYPKSFLFSSLDASDLQAVVLAMKGPLVYGEGDQLITEGDSGDHLYIIESGTLDCLKLIAGVNSVVKTCVPGDLFGELALLYNCPRKASVITREASVLWEMDRETFNGIVMEAVQKKRSQCYDVLKRVPLFQQLSEGEFQNFIDALKMERFSQGATIIQQGEEGNHFYIVYDGSVVAHRYDHDSQEYHSMEHSVGDYFGELALLHDAPRAATVVASSSEVQLLSMDRAAFKRLMGSVEDFLERSSVRYE